MALGVRCIVLSVEVYEGLRRARESVMAGAVHLQQLEGVGRRIDELGRKKFRRSRPNLMKQFSKLLPRSNIVKLPLGPPPIFEGILVRLFQWLFLGTVVRLAFEKHTSLIFSRLASASFDVHSLRMREYWVKGDNFPVLQKCC